MKLTEAHKNLDFRSFLKKELSSRIDKNPSYSLRAFSKMLGISHTSLSQILSGKRPLTNKTQKQIAMALGVSLEKFVKFKMHKDIKFEERFEALDIEKFDALSDWLHDAILELTRLKCFKPDSKWMANTLQVNVNQVNLAIERLIKLELLEIKDGKWIDVSVNNTTNHIGDYSNVALRKYQKGIINKSLDALEKVPREQRDHTSLMLNFSASDIKKAKKMIKEFRKEFSTSSQEQSSDADGVYALSISFFPITKLKNQELK